MVEHTNKLKKLPATQAYVDFGLEQTKAINKRFREWLAQQSFADDVVSSEFGHMTFDGHSEYNSSIGHRHEKYPDKVEWDLQFSDKVKNKDLDDALLHEERYPNVTTFNSKPRIFDTADYIQISVTNGERGWVKTGEFPVNVHVEKDYDARAENLHAIQELPDIALQTDVRREALAGFEAALEWQKFRAMALACSNFIATQIKKENKKVTDYDSSQYMRSRREHVYPFFVQLLPDTRLDEGPSALKSFYRPGILEGALTLELEHIIRQQFGRIKSGDFRPVYLANGYPIEITSTGNDAYDALMKFHVHLFSYGPKDDEAVRLAMEKQLQKKYNVALSTPSEMEVALELKNAHQVEGAIRDGATDTELHRFARTFGNALRHTTTALEVWYKKLPGLKQTYEKMIQDAKHFHFSELEAKISKE